MPNAIDFYFDFGSPYGYFASTVIDDLAARHGRGVDWHPVLLDTVFKTTGATPLPLIPLKGAYSVRDVERTARFHKIAFRKPDNFPVPTQNAARAMLWAQSAKGDEMSVRLARAIFQAAFVDNRNISDTAVLAELASGLGLDGAALLDGVQSAAIKEQLRAETDLAMAKGVFGSPFVIVDGEPFWGFDRLDQVEALLRDGRV
ncbi:MAG: hypothetical protein RLY78_4018 [Pseudomonadota bacterium]|jgi:2-hydroxychromene-2-carboxylate isomerase|uniref:2-hydroxychromene-2-carboxylate isomerase n=1 Tax=Pseudaquabacterium rugosum TaxID=2984194 RepID=A0ABU9BF17_9BURK